MTADHGLFGVVGGECLLLYSSGINWIKSSALGRPKLTITLRLSSTAKANIWNEYSPLKMLCGLHYCVTISKSATRVIFATGKSTFGRQGSSLSVIRIRLDYKSGRRNRKKANCRMEMATLRFPIAGVVQQTRRRSGSVLSEEIMTAD
jgi:hypothetical protein